MGMTEERHLNICVTRRVTESQGGGNEIAEVTGRTAQMMCMQISAATVVPANNSARRDCVQDSAGGSSVTFVALHENLLLRTWLVPAALKGMQRLCLTTTLE